MSELAVSTAVTLVIGIIGYFLKRTMSRVDKHDTDIEKIKEDTIKKAEHEKDMSEVEADIKKIREDYTPKETHSKDFDECRDDIKKIKEDYITKEDFFREQQKTDRKLDKIMDILLEMKGDKGNGR